MVVIIQVLKTKLKETQKFSQNRDMKEEERL